VFIQGQGSLPCLSPVHPVPPGCWLSGWLALGVPWLGFPRVRGVEPDNNGSVVKFRRVGFQELALSTLDALETGTWEAGGGADVSRLLSYQGFPFLGTSSFSGLGSFSFDTDVRSSLAI
jgi:hypothetical protein